MSPICCQALTASCIACKNNMTVDEYCKKNPTLYDCPQILDNNKKNNNKYIVIIFTIAFISIIYNKWIYKKILNY